MGNCMNLSSWTNKEKIKVVIFNGGEEEFMASTTVEQISSCGPYKGYQPVHHSQPMEVKPLPGEVCYHLHPHLAPAAGCPVSKNASLVGRIRIVLTKKQLKELLMTIDSKSCPEEFARKVIESCRKVRGVHRKWRPALATVLELPSY